MNEEELTPAEYEELVRDLVGQLEATHDVRRIRLERDVHLSGRTTDHQVDVLWEYEAAGVTYQLIFECRRYKSRLKQKDAFAWVGVVRDLAEAGYEAIGAMVTSTGYQRGAKAVAEGNGVLITELRRPTPEDMQGRVRQIELDVAIRQPQVLSMGFEAPPGADDQQPLDSTLHIKAAGNDLWIRTGKGQQLVAHAQLDGIAQPMGSPETGPHTVRHDYDPPAELVSGGRVLARVSAMVVVGMESIVHIKKTIGWGDAVVYMARNALTGQRAWIEPGGRTTFTAS